LPAAAGGGVADHTVELGIFGRFAALLLGEIDAEGVEGLVALEHVDRPAAEGRDEVKGFEFGKLAEGAIERGLVQFGRLQDLARIEIDALEASAGDEALDGLQNSALDLGFFWQEIGEGRGECRRNQAHAADRSTPENGRRIPQRTTDCHCHHCGQRR